MICSGIREEIALAYGGLSALSKIFPSGSVLVDDLCCHLLMAVRKEWFHSPIEWKTCHVLGRVDTRT